MFRMLFLFASMAGGVWGSFRVLENIIRQAGGPRHLEIAAEAMPILIPVGMVGALAGLLIGGIMLPVKR